MKRLTWLACFVVLALGVVRAEESFSKSVPAEKFSAAGLGKLSAEELGQLDALVRDYKAGVLAAKREAASMTMPVPKQEPAPPAAPLVKEKKSETGLLA